MKVEKGCEGKRNDRDKWGIEEDKPMEQGSTVSGKWECWKERLKDWGSYLVRLTNGSEGSEDV